MTPSRAIVAMIACLIALVAASAPVHAAPGDPTWFLVNQSPYNFGDWSGNYYDLYPNRGGSATVFDSRRGRFLVLSGASIIHFGPGAYYVLAPAEILSLDLAGSRHWEALTPPGSYPQLAYSTAAYDSLTDRVWLFGGGASNGAIYPSFVPTGELWSLDVPTSTWTLVSGNGAVPPRRMRQSMAFDPVRRELLVFGGLDSLGGALGDAWSYAVDGGAWTPLSPAGASPTARSRSLAAYDPDSDRVWIAAGQSDTGALADVWTLERSPADRWRQIPVPAGGLSAQSSGFYDARDHQLVGLGVLDTTVIFTLLPSDQSTGWSYRTAFGRASHPSERQEVAWDAAGRWVMPAGSSLDTGGIPSTYGFRLDPLPVRAFQATLDSLRFFDGVTYSTWQASADGPMWAPIQFVLSSDKAPDAVTATVFPDPLSPIRVNDPSYAPQAAPGSHAAYRIVWFDGASRQVAGPYPFDTPPDPAHLDIGVDTIGVFDTIFGTVAVQAHFFVRGDSAHLLTPLVAEHRLNGGPWEVLQHGYPGTDDRFVVSETGAYVGSSTYDYRLSWGDGLPPRQTPVYSLVTRPIPQFVSQAAGYDSVTIKWHVPPGSGIQAIVYMVYSNGSSPVDTLSDDAAGDIVFSDTTLAPVTDYVFKLGWAAYGGIQYGAEIPITTLGGEPIFLGSTSTSHSIQLDFRLAPVPGWRVRLLRHLPGSDILVGERAPDSDGYLHLLDDGLQPDHAYSYLPERVYDGGTGVYPLITLSTLPGTEPPQPPDTTVVAMFAPPAPNPVTDLLHFTCSVPAGQTGRLELFDLSGRRRWSTDVPGGRVRSITYDLKGLESGVYLARLTVPGHTFQRRVAVVR